MALRTFHFNPSLGGFGSAPSAEAATPDAFCQIIKELVDNAVDACIPAEKVKKANRGSSGAKKEIHGSNNHKEGNSGKNVKRVRVVIERFQDDNLDNANDQATGPASFDGAKDKNSDRCQILRVTVSDNGCGMQDIQKCVKAFNTSKAHTQRLGNEIKDKSNCNDKTKAVKPKAGEKNKQKNKKDAASSSKKTCSTTSLNATPEEQTAGRYGIGLTLCLVHAQRLVPNSCASIRSARSDHSQWTSLLCVVDTAHDSIRCILEDEVSNTPSHGSQQIADNEKTNRHQASLNKRFPTESGTSISILVPGGKSSRMAWPRLAEYFARFKLSLGLPCTLEVLAPTLSRIPLLVRPALFQQQQYHIRGKQVRKQGDNEVSKKITSKTITSVVGKNSNNCFTTVGNADTFETPVNDDERHAVCNATQIFLGRPVDQRNVAHSVVPIRSEHMPTPKPKAGDRNQKQVGPRLKVSIIVTGPNEDSDVGFEELASDTEGFHSEEDELPPEENLESTKKSHLGSSSATMTLIRMVNNIPLLDSSEALACGLVQGVASKKSVWSSFGLEVNIMPSNSMVENQTDNKTPAFDVRDSEQVAPFFKRGSHALLESGYNQFYRDEEESFISDSERLEHEDDDVSNGIEKRGRNLRKEAEKKNQHRRMLPASLRLGNILIIAQIHAEPTSLPLPSLSKGCLPVDNVAIDNALERGITDCLRQLQKTNPYLLLTASELKKAERDYRYVPAVAAAMASILTKSQSKNQELLDIIQRWKTKGTVENCRQFEEDASFSVSSPLCGVLDLGSDHLQSFGSLIEERFRLVLLQNPSENKGAGTKPKVTEQAQDLDEGQLSQEGEINSPAYSVGIDWDLLKEESSDEDDRKLKKSDRKKLKLDQKGTGKDYEACFSKRREISPESDIKKADSQRGSDDICFEDWF